MVLFKRKPVQFLTPPTIQDDDAEVWHIPQTGEIFTTYEAYLYRMDFYKQSRFICQITGRSCLTFFDALKSELAGAEEVEQAFPEALKGPILRRVQFSTVSRIDTLVDQIFDEFKADYYPGESVQVHIYTGERAHGVVRDKTRFGSKVLPDGTLTPPFSRYFVSLDDRPKEEAVVDDQHISRDRKVFTKAVLRSFIKKTVTREAWNGAPWLVKQHVAEQYHIDTRVPQHLRHDTKLLERKQLQLQKKIHQPSDTNGVVSPLQAPGPLRLPELKPAFKQKGKNQSGQQQQQQQQQQSHKGRQNVFVNNDAGVVMQLPLLGAQYQGPISFRTQMMAPPAFAHPEPPPPPPPPKYPIEDLQLEPRGAVRPAMKFMCNDPPVKIDGEAREKIQMRSIGPLLETWDTLNVYCEIFKLDSFTFDDYVEAMEITSEEVPCQLFEEIHCAVLKLLVTPEADGANIEITLPELDEEDEEEEEGNSGLPSPTPEPQPKPVGRATRGSLAKLEAERIAAEAAAAEKEAAEAQIPHLAAEVLADYDWVEHLSKRDFKHGGWEMIMVGLLHQLSKDERYTASCDELLKELVPKNVEPTQDTVRQHYASLDINHRAQALQIICMLTSETKAIRGYMEDCSETMTAYRKEKIDWQRQRKQAIEELKALNEQRKILLPDNMPPSPTQQAAKTNGETKDVKMADLTESAADTTEAADSDDDPRRGRNLRKAKDRAAERHRKREEEKERKKEAEAAAKVPKQSKQFLKVLKDIEKKEELIKKCEDEIAVIDNDLREADCPRTRVLGKDRFWNRYYWFERNGMPYGGLPDSSTAEAGYANGCIWVQGPDELEREGYIDMIPEYQNEYKAKFDITVPERKKDEEGATSVYNAREWGYFSEPEDVDRLLEWLDPRGFNELKLRKEILAFKDKIVKNMENRKEYLAPPAAADKDKDKKDDSSKRMSTRTKTQPTPEPPQHRCLKWQNTTALEEIGHLHSEQPPAPRPKKPTKKKEAVEPGPKKGPSRQGTRYTF